MRANDTTDIWNSRGGSYPTLPSRPFRTADLAAVRPFCDLVLYSVDLQQRPGPRPRHRSRPTARSASEAADLGMRHFLEVFNPNAPVGLAAGDVGAFVNDSIVRTLAGVTSAQRPLFLKMAYNGADALAELVEHDPSRGRRHPRRLGRAPPATRSSCCSGRSGTALGSRCSGARSSARSRSWTWSG